MKKEIDWNEWDDLENILISSEFNEKFQDDWNELEGVFQSVSNSEIELLKTKYSSPSHKFKVFLHWVFGEPNNDINHLFWQNENWIFSIHNSFGNPGFALKNNTDEKKAYEIWQNFISKIKEKLPKAESFLIEDFEIKRGMFAVLPKVNWYSNSKKWKLANVVGHNMIVAGAVYNGQIELKGIQEMTKCSWWISPVEDK